LAARAAAAGLALLVGLGALGVAWGGVGPADAGPPGSPRAALREGWTATWDIMLDEALYGTTREIGDRYRGLMDAAPADDPTLALLQLEVGNVAWLVGDLPAAREALDACIRGGNGDSALKARCLDLRAGIDLETDAVRAVPVTWTFDDAHHGFIHPREHWVMGGIRIDAAGALVWSTKVDGVRDDELVVAFRGVTPAPRQVRIRLSARLQDGAVLLWLDDAEGRRYQLPARPVKLPQGESVDVTLRLADAAPVTPGAPPLDPARLDRLVLADQSSLVGAFGPLELVIDEFEVR
jgi:hypothetical protein